MSRWALSWGVAVCVLVVACAACASHDGMGSSTTSTSSGGGGARRDLEATSWSLAESTSLGVPNAGVAVSAEFREERVVGSSGCNTYRGPFETSGSSMRIGPEIVTTRMACASGPSAVEAAYLARLRKVRSYRIDGDTLTLRGANGAALLVYDAVEGTTAIAGSWDATSYYSGNAVESVAPGSTLTAVFASGMLSGDGGCNMFGAPYTVHGDEITFGPFTSTTRACADPVLQAQEHNYLSALEAARTFTVTADSLQLLRAGGTIAATFERSPTG